MIGNLQLGILLLSASTALSTSSGHGVDGHHRGDGSSEHSESHQALAGHHAHNDGHGHDDAHGGSALTHGAGHDHHDHSSCNHVHSISAEASTAVYFAAFGAGICVPLLSTLGNLACRYYFKDGVSKFLPILVSFGAGTMLASATVSFIPEAILHTELGADAHRGAFLSLGLPILLGILVSIIMEFLIHSLGGHSHDHDSSFDDVEAVKVNNNAGMQAMAWNMLMADALHNAIDGMLIGTTFVTSLWQGVITTMLIIFHELPQEIAELCVLLHAGWPMRKAIVRNCLSTLTILFGIGIGLALAHQFEFIQTYCMGFIAGELLYVALGQLLPSLARTMMTRRQSICCFIAFGLGIGFISLLTCLFPHSHGSSVGATCSH